MRDKTGPGPQSDHSDRTLSPRTEYRGDEGYPALEPAPEAARAPAPTPAPEALDRRGFLSRAAGTAVAAGGALLGGGSPARGAPRPGEQKVTVRFPYGSRIQGSGYRADRVELWTRDRRLARFLRSSKERAGLGKALAGPVAKVKADTLYDGRKLYQLERRLARALTRRYRERTGRHARAPDLMLHVRQGYSGIRTAGVMVRPTIQRKAPRPPRRRP